MNSVTQKQCTKCGEIKDSSCFVKDPSKKDGLYSSCKDCYKKNYSPNKYKETRKKYKEENREELLRKKCEKRIEFREENLQKLKEYHKNNKEKEKAYREKNRDRLNAVSALWALFNKDKRSEALRRWRNNHPEKVFVQKANRHSLERGAEGRITNEEWFGLLEKYGHKCLCCKRDDVKLTQDHVLPLVLGGKNTIDNIQPLCRSCNSRKHAKYIDYR